MSAAFAPFELELASKPLSLAAGPGRGVRARWRAAVVVQTAVRRLLTRHRDGRLRLLTMRRRARAVVVLLVYTVALVPLGFIISTTLAVGTPAITFIGAVGAAARVRAHERKRHLPRVS